MGDVPVFGSNGPVGTHSVANTLSPAIIVGRKGSFGKVTWTSTPAFCIDTAYFIDRRHTEGSLRWLFWALQTLGLDEQSEDTGVPGLSREKAYATKLLRPSCSEQERIANFLDEQTSRIDALIAEKERLVEVLGHHAQAVVDAVTVADDRAQAKLGYFVDFLPGYAFPSEEFSRDPGDVPLLRGVNVTPFGVRWDDAVYWPRDYDEALARFVLKPGDVVLGMDRPWISTGARVTLIDDAAAGSLLLQRVCRLRGGPKIQQRFIYYALASDVFRQSVEVEMTGVSVPHLSPEQILRFKVPVLSLDEQAERCGRAERALSGISKLQEHTDNMLTRLREYRSSLISAAVTGRLDISTYEAKAA